MICTKKATGSVDAVEVVDNDRREVACNFITDTPGASSYNSVSYNTLSYSTNRQRMSSIYESARDQPRLSSELHPRTNSMYSRNYRLSLSNTTPIRRLNISHAHINDPPADGAVVESEDICYCDNI